MEPMPPAPAPAAKAERHRPKIIGLLGLTFVLVTLFAPKGIGGLFDRFTGAHAPDRKGAPLGPDAGALQEGEAEA